MRISADFRRQILSTWRHRCAVTEDTMQIQIAHIVPVAVSQDLRRESWITDPANVIPLAPDIHKHFDNWYFIFQLGTLITLDEPEAIADSRVQMNILILCDVGEYRSRQLKHQSVRLLKTNVPFLLLHNLVALGVIPYCRDDTEWDVKYLPAGLNETERYRWVLNHAPIDFGSVEAVWKYLKSIPADLIIKVVDRGFTGFTFVQWGTHSMQFKLYGEFAEELENVLWDRYENDNYRIITSTINNADTNRSDPDYKPPRALKRRIELISEDSSDSGEESDSEMNEPLDLNEDSDSELEEPLDLDEDSDSELDEPLDLNEDSDSELDEPLDLDDLDESEPLDLDELEEPLDLEASEKSIIDTTLTAGNWEQFVM